MRAWRDVVTRGRVSQTYRGTGSSRYEKLSCGHSIRLTGNRVFDLAKRRVCKACQEIEDRDATRDDGLRGMS